MNIIDLHPGNLPLLTARPLDCHKGALGHVVILAGAPGMSDAGVLAAQRCLRPGPASGDIVDRSGPCGHQPRSAT